ncbi:unnamed protein product [Peronospora farinosa]|uniref:F-box domain-containing protein n=1 Tax=Peronospora farinosa TaxID=134698 RepID=A0ABN8CGE5_9STRA|nr:unnamed protein product [Peronospora farinosa]
MDGECGTLVASFLSLRERRELRLVSRRWLFTCTWLQYNGSGEAYVQPRKSVWSLCSRAFRHSWTTFIRNKSYSTTTFFQEQTGSQWLHRAEDQPLREPPTLLLTKELSELRSELFGSKQPECWNIALYGGGPGYDALGLVFMREFFELGTSSSTPPCTTTSPAGNARFMQSKKRWKNLANETLHCFQHCDITLDGLLKKTPLRTCSYGASCNAVTAATYFTVDHRLGLPSLT